MRLLQVAPTERPNSSPLRLFDRLEAAHHEVLNCVVCMERVTSADVPDVQQLTSTRFKFSQASFARRALWHNIRDLLQPSVTPADAASLHELTELDLRLFSASSSHISRWTVQAILADWKGYQAASRLIRAHIVRSIKAEEALLYPLLRIYG